MANNNHFDLNLDTLGPSGTVSVPSYIRAANAAVTLTKQANWKTSTDHGATQSTLDDTKYMKVWLEKKGDSTKKYPSTPAWENFSTSKVIYLTADGTSTGTAVEGIYVVKALIMDDVGNETDISSSTGNKEVNFDKTAPTISSVTIADPTKVTGQPVNETNSLTNNVTVVVSDGPSGTASGVPSGKITISGPTNMTYAFVSQSGTTYNFTITFPSGTTEGTKTITVNAKDNAGNDATAKTASIYYDPDANNVNLYLYKESGRTTLVPASPSYTNLTTVYPRLQKSTSGQADFVAYQIWGFGSQTTDPGVDGTWTTLTTATGTIAPAAITLNGSETTKDLTQTISARVKDDVGNVSEVRTYTVKIDREAPTGSIKVSPAVISAKDATASGDGTAHNTATITYSVADDNGSSGSNIASWEIKINDTKLTSGTTNKTNAEAPITNATSGMKAGSNTISLVMTDKAGNTTTKTATITLDTTNPTLSVVTPAAGTWYNASTLQYKVSSVSETCSGYFWVDKSSTSTATVPSGTAAVSLTTASSTIAKSDVKNGNPPTESSTLYFHYKVVDSVGNYSNGVVAFKYDQTKPSIDNAAFSSTVYGSTTAKVVVTASDNLSNVAQFMFPTKNDSGTTINADITSPKKDEWINWSSTMTSGYDVTLTSGDGEKELYIKVKDNAGNISALSSKMHCELDTTAPTGSLTLRVKNSTIAKPDPSNIADTDMYAVFVDDTITEHGVGSYKIWGDIDGEKGTESEATWVTFTTGGSTNITLHKACTAGDAVKYFNIKFKDNAGNESPTYTASFEYDVTAIDAGVTHDYDKISKIHTERWSAANTVISGKYNDYVVCKVFPRKSDGTQSTEKYIACKLVAYANATLAARGSHADAAIEGCTWSSTTAKTGETQLTITGANFEKALNGGTTPSTAHAMDGTHIVVAYIQDEAGTWSEAANWSV